MAPSKPALPHTPTLATFARPAPTYSSNFSLGLSCQFSPSSRTWIPSLPKSLSLSLTADVASPEAESPTTAK